MRKLALVCFLGLLAFFKPVMAMNNVVVISATDVASAADIEIAIQEATGYGTYAGTVILDGKNGPFIYSQPDRSINIAYSNFRLRGVNGAEVANCDDGLFFDDFVTSNITIENITFHCSYSGIIAVLGTHDQVTVRNNVIEGTLMGIEVSGGNGWVITGNQVNAGAEAINLHGSSGSFIANNLLAGSEIAIILDLAQRNHITRNKLTASWQGVLLIYGTNDNRITYNQIVGPRHSGISFEGGSTGNLVLRNYVTCAADTACLAVSGSPQIFIDNRIAGNKIR